MATVREFFEKARDFEGKFQVVARIRTGLFDAWEAAPGKILTAILRNRMVVVRVYFGDKTEIASLRGKAFCREINNIKKCFTVSADLLNNLRSTSIWKKVKMI